MLPSAFTPTFCTFASILSEGIKIRDGAEEDDATIFSSAALGTSPVAVNQTEVTSAYKKKKGAPATTAANTTRSIVRVIGTIERLKDAVLQIPGCSFETTSYRTNAPL